MYDDVHRFQGQILEILQVKSDNGINFVGKNGEYSKGFIYWYQDTMCKRMAYD